MDLIESLLKFATILTLVRLASTAFGWEFGISRHYLRLLELLLQLGQRRIEKVESGQFMAGAAMTQACHGNNNSNVPAADRDKQNRNGAGSIHHGATAGHDKAACPTSLPLEPKRRHSSLLPPDLESPKARRVSTPDGPPVFLLDGYSDDDDDDDDDHDDDASSLGRELGAQKDLPAKAAAVYGRLCNHHHDGDQVPAHISYDDHVKQNRLEANRGKHRFHLSDPSKLIMRAIDAIIDDQVTKRFSPKELKSWNLLTRTNAKNYQFMSRSLGLFWILGLLVRYALLMPMRIMFTLAGFLWLIATMSLIGLLPRGCRQRPYKLTSLMAFRMLSCGLTSRLEFHNRQYRAKNGNICVANHTSPLDVVLLACDNCYALVGQRHGGLLGILEQFLSRASNHVWFDRFEVKDRQLVSRRLREHVQGTRNLPILIFPEGTCINNSAVMMFKKGAFETTDRVYPLAIKYDARFGDPYWNSAKHGYLQYLLLMMSSWAIKCQVWYLPPMDRLADESSFEFANRVKAEIAKQGGLLDLNWDGQLKRMAAKIEWKQQQQEDFVKRLRLD